MDNIFNSKVRVKILALLYGVKYCEFNYLLKKLETSPGNLWSHLKKLEREGYIEIKKYPLKKGVRTVVKITDKGIEKFREYLNELLELSGGGI
ncbi:MAG TPA: winged helix-turn-helix transcriptional regulator [Methanothermococcus okinawensis]|uniref:Winged helix-turn-helix transcriptional regulator n=1 Tax=Methanothermococcus okinawensis TaxID=155863 RepID=A0A832ZM53_9EURY|nr:winged helix-turn-helix transcriptional regulator [Methanothermococcus okinawensis]